MDHTPPPDPSWSHRQECSTIVASAGRLGLVKRLENAQKRVKYEFVQEAEDTAGLPDITDEAIEGHRVLAKIGSDSERGARVRRDLLGIMGIVWDKRDLNEDHALQLLNPDTLDETLRTGRTFTRATVRKKDKILSRTYVLMRWNHMPNETWECAIDLVSWMGPLVLRRMLFSAANTCNERYQE